MSNPLNHCVHCCEAVEVTRLQGHVVCARCGTAIRTETESEKQLFLRIEDYAKLRQIDEKKAVETLLEIALDHIGFGRKIVINICYGGFCISKFAAEQIAKRKNIPLEEINTHAINREDHDLIWAVETLGRDCWTSYSQQKVIVIPNDVQYVIRDYDGIESVHETHRVWR